MNPFRAHRMSRRTLGCYLGYLAMHLLLSPFLVVKGWMRAKRRAYSKILWQRLLGGSRPSIPQGGVLFIAGGMGEARPSLFAAEQLLARRGVPCQVLVQRENAAQLSHPKIPIGALPFNNPISAWLCLRRYRPRAIFIVEFADNHHLMMLANLLRVPTFLFNVMLTEAEVKRVLGHGSLWRWQLPSCYFAQLPLHAERLKRLGIPEERIEVVGMIGVQGTEELPRDAWRSKWLDLLPEAAKVFPVMLAGSSHEEDEPFLLDAFESLKEQFPDALLILAPRDLKRASGWTKVLDARSIQYARRSEMPGAPIPPSRIVALDTYGELREVYSIAHLAFVGGSFTKVLGGHTPVEALPWGLPLTMGPYYEQQRLFAQELSERGILKLCDNAEELAQAWIETSSDTALREKIAKASQAYLAEQDDKIVQVWDRIKS